MLVIPTTVKPSPIHGLGLFTDVDLERDQVIWVFNRLIDTVIRLDELCDLPDHVKEFLEQYSWQDDSGNYHIGVDNDKYINHFPLPNTYFDRELHIYKAVHPVEAGCELTQDYQTYSEIERKKYEQEKSC